jgi:hypothetical protein
MVRCRRKMAHCCSIRSHRFVTGGDHQVSVIETVGMVRNCIRNCHSAHHSEPRNQPISYSAGLIHSSQ